jgi:DNA-binding transcriptional regulator YiaG
MRADTPRAVIEAAQHATGLSQVALAELLGVDPSALRRWLSGARAMPEPARRLCRALAHDPSLVMVITGD